MHSFDETLELMRIELEQGEGTLLLIGICDDIELRDYTIKELRKRLSPEIGLRDFRYDPEHISLLEAAVETLKSRNGRVVLSITGLEELPRDKWSEAIKLLNLQRNRFGYTGAAVILWVNRATLAEISMKSADFFSWRSGTFIIEPPPGWDTLASARKTYLHAVVARNEFVNLQGLAPTRGGHIVQMRMEDIFIPLQVEQEEKSTNAALTRVLFSFGERTIEVDITRNAKGEFVASTTAEGYTARFSGKPSGSGTVPGTLSVEGNGGWQGISLNLREEYPLRLPLHEVKPRPVEMPDLLQERHAIVLGDPGAGKTTLLRYLAYVIAKAQTVHWETEITTRHPELTKCLPVYVRIGEYAQHLQYHPEATLNAFIPLSCQGRQLPLSEELFSETLQQGRIVLLLDGLDEIVETGRRRDITQQVEAFTRAHPQCRVIVTSRIVGYREAQLSSKFAQFTIRPFADPEIQRFAEKWYAALDLPNNAAGLVQAVQENPSVHRLATNPLLLTVIALIHWRGAKLPQHRAKLYSQAAETLIDQWMSHRRVRPDEWDVTEVQQVLLPAIAWRIHSTTSSGLIGEYALQGLLVETLRQHDAHLREDEAHRRAAQFRRNVSEFSGIFLERGLDEEGRGLYGFLHLTFEEYFAAVCLADKWEREGKSALTPLLHVPRWTEVILLTAGHLGESSQYRATEFVKAVLSARSEYEKILRRDLLLAARCLSDDVRVDTQLRRKILTKLLNLYFSTESPYSLQEDIRQVFSRLGETTYGKDLLEALIERLTDSGGPRRRAAEALGQLGARAVTHRMVSALLKCLADLEWHVRWAAARALGQLGAATATPEIVSALLKILTDHKSNVREVGAWTLGQMGKVVATPEVLSTLINRLSNPVWEVRYGAANALQEMRQVAATPEVMSTLLKLLINSDTKVRSVAAITLSGLGRAAATPQVLLTLLKLLTDPDDEGRRAAAVALSGMGQAAATPEVLSALLKLLSDSNEFVRSAAAQALGELWAAIGTPEIVTTLLKYLTDSNVFVRRAAAVALSGMGQAAATPEVLSALLKLLPDSDSYTCRAAVEALGRLGAIAGTPPVVTALLKCLTTPDWYVREAAAEALGQLGSSAATPAILQGLLTCLTDADGTVRRAAVRTLQKLSSFLHLKEWPEAPALFVPLARSRNEEKREVGYVCLRNLLVGEQEGTMQA